MTHEGHQQVSSLVNDLVVMAEATKRLPELERQIREYQEQSRMDGDTIARLERKLMERSTQIDELNSKLRSVEAERDDAGFRLLEADDKVNATERALGDMQATLSALIGAIRKPEPAPAEVVPTTVESTADGGLSQTAHSESVASPEPVAFTEPQSFEVTESEIKNGPAMGQSDSHPTVSGEPIPFRTVPEHTASGSAGAPSDVDAEKTKYVGKYYIEVPGFISRSDWIDGGGTNETYDWRAGQPRVA